MYVPPSSVLAVIYLVIEQPRQRLNHWVDALASLDAPHAPPIRAAVAHYDASSDEALLELQYERTHFDDKTRRYATRVALDADVGMIQPDALTAEERGRFVGARLARSTCRFDPQPSVVGALMQLALEHGDDPCVTSPDPAPRIDHHKTNRLPPRPLSRGSSPPRRNDEDHITSPLDLAAFQAMAAVRRHPDRIHVRYLRGGRWQPARLGAVGLRGAALLTGVLPRVNDHLDVALSFGDRRAIVRGIVAKASTRSEAAALGTGVFTLQFLLDEYSRPRLTAVLVAARDAKVTIAPPPPRASRRFPVAWNVALDTPKGVVNATALDLSVGGMFVRCDAPLLLDAVLRCSIMLDDDRVPVVGRVKTVRRITESDAMHRDLVAGFGLALVDMADAHRARWLRFVARIERRAEKRVMIGADPSRFTELQASLSSLGYAVIGGTDPGMLVQLANSASNPADAVLIDGGWVHDDTSTALVEELFTSRNVPCVTLHGEVLRARQTIDRLLRVA